MNERESPIIAVSEIIKQLREERGLSIRELSRVSGISANALSMIERGLTSPSVSTLYRLTDALNVPITALFRHGQEQETVVFRSTSTRRQVPFPRGLWEGLGGEAFVGRVHPFMITLESEAESGSEKIVHTGHEFVFCLQGLIEYEVEGKLYQLREGDTLLFSARLAHRWRNPGKTTARAVIVLSGFEEYEKPEAYHYPAES